jgi:hypothetical protein
MQSAIESGGMKKNIIDRTWLSPFVTLAFGVIAVTGVLLFFHIKNGILMTLHEWFGWGFVVAGVVHLFLNWRPLLSYVKRPSAIIALMVGVMLIAGLTAIGANKQNRGGGGRPMSQLSAVLDVNGDGILDAKEMANAGMELKMLDRDGDGQVNAEEQMSRPAEMSKLGHAPSNITVK